MSLCRCCSVSPRIWNTVSFWTGQLAVTRPWSRCASWLPFLSPPTPPQSIVQPSPSTLCKGRLMSWTDWGSMGIAQLLNRWDKSMSIVLNASTCTDPFTSVLFTERSNYPAAKNENINRVWCLYYLCWHTWYHSPSGQSSPTSCCPPCDVTARMDPVAAYHYWQQVSWEIYFCHAIR